MNLSPYYHNTQQCYTNEEWETKGGNRMFVIVLPHLVRSCIWQANTLDRISFLNKNNMEREPMAQWIGQEFANFPRKRGDLGGVMKCKFQAAKTWPIMTCMNLPLHLSDLSLVGDSTASVRFDVRQQMEGSIIVTDKRFNHCHQLLCYTKVTFFSISRTYLSN